MAPIQEIIQHSQGRFMRFVACVCGAASLAACTSTQVTADATLAPVAAEMPTVIAHSYCADSGALDEFTLFSDGTATYRPTGALVGSAVVACGAAAC